MPRALRILGITAAVCIGIVAAGYMILQAVSFAFEVWFAAHLHF